MPCICKCHQSQSSVSCRMFDRLFCKAYILKNCVLPYIGKDQQLLSCGSCIVQFIQHTVKHLRQNHFLAQMASLAIMKANSYEFSSVFIIFFEKKCLQELPNCHKNLILIKHVNDIFYQSLKCVRATYLSKICLFNFEKLSNVTTNVNTID